MNAYLHHANDAAIVHDRSLRLCTPFDIRTMCLLIRASSHCVDTFLLQRKLKYQSQSQPPRTAVAICQSSSVAGRG
jgi:hypothetical protein